MTPALVRLRSAGRRLSAELAEFGAWWLHELRDVRSAFAERFASDRSQRLMLELGAHRAVIHVADAATGSRQIDFALTDGTDLPPLQQIWPEAAPQQARVSVVLPQAAVLLCHLRLPPLSEREVARAVELQLETELPLPREQLYVDWKVREKLADRSRVVVVAAARRTYVDRLRDSIRSWGWRAVSMSGDSEQGQPQLNLLPPPARRLSLDVGRRELYLTGSALALCAAYVTIVLGQWWYERSSLAGSLDQARVQLANIDRQRAALSTEGKPIVSLSELMETPSAAQALVALSAVVPQDSWVYQADIGAAPSGGVTVALEGYTPTAAALLGALEKSAEFEQVQLVEAANAGVGTELERVELTARLRAGEHQ